MKVTDWVTGAAGRGGGVTGGAGGGGGFKAIRTGGKAALTGAGLLCTSGGLAITGPRTTSFDGRWDKGHPVVFHHKRLSGIGIRVGGRIRLVIGCRLREQPSAAERVWLSGTGSEGKARAEAAWPPGAGFEAEAFKDRNRLLTQPRACWPGTTAAFKRIVFVSPTKVLSG